LICLQNKFLAYKSTYFLSKKESLQRFFFVLTLVLFWRFWAFLCNLVKILNFYCMQHTPPIFLAHGHKTTAYFSVVQPKQLLVFVHGFNGSSVGTWEEFPDLLREDPDFAQTDLVFYGYDSLKGQANNNGLRFYNCLKALASPGLPEEERWGFERSVVAEDFEYERIILVAHSLGSIVLRRALLNAKADEQPWLAQSQMVLFAPAHRGARIQKLVEYLPMFGRMLAGLGFVAMPVLEDLKPDSEAIKNLMQESQKLIDEGKGNFAIAAKVVWANNERVVHNERFCQDPVAELVDDQSHSSVCKPQRPDFLRPLEIIKGLI
jgi:pimeloyl-ACP methyl ester carboxylesterase